MQRFTTAQDFRWTDFGVLAQVRRKGKLVGLHVRHMGDDGYFGQHQEVAPRVAVQLIERGYALHTVLVESTTRDGPVMFVRGKPLHLVRDPVGRAFLRTDANHVLEDNLESLPLIERE